jgi:predicted pyridoxine 5'-phosphate oxidase superfamily flavin-nucleotide-binding protein
MAKIPGEVAELLKDKGTPKIVATVDQDGVPNATIKGSVMAIDDTTLAFADLYGGKSRTFSNLKETKQVSVLVFKFPFAPPLAAYQIKGKFDQYLTSGPVFDQFAKMIKELIGADITGVATMKVDSVYSQAPQDAGKKVA